MQFLVAKGNQSYGIIKVWFTNKTFAYITTFG